MFDFHFLFKISQLDVSWTGYHCSWYPLSINHDIQLELLLVRVFFLSKCLQPMKLPPSHNNHPPPQKRKNPSFEEQPSLIPTLKIPTSLKTTSQNSSSPKF